MAPSSKTPQQQLDRSIRENLHFLSAEVRGQLEQLKIYLAHLQASQARWILDRSGYALNLHERIHNRALQLHSDSSESQQPLRASEVLATQLERISELCRECVHQAGYLHNKSGLSKKDFNPALNRVLSGILLMEQALLERNSTKALEMGEIEEWLDEFYRKRMQRFAAHIREGEDSNDPLSLLLIGMHIEQMGDALLRMSEAIISANIGQSINLSRYRSLKASVKKLELKRSKPLKVQHIADTRSGSAISGIGRDDKEGYLAIFKEGKRRKVKEERAGVESWHQIIPGLAPRILSYKKHGESASMLIEHLAGETFEQILLQGEDKLLLRCQKSLHKTLVRIWDATRIKKSIAANHMEQLQKRLSQVYAVHPEFELHQTSICGHIRPSTHSLIARAARLEKQLKPPFSVYLHGDFNIDNIIYDPVERHINFIDLHRSRHMDYVQDIAVFMVSNYRLQVLDPPLRRRIVETILRFYNFASDYAAKAGDRQFEVRLALGLARSMMSSTRFILDRDMANTMYQRGRYLLERVVETPPNQLQSFTLPIEEIFIG